MQLCSYRIHSSTDNDDDYVEHCVIGCCDQINTKRTRDSNRKEFHVLLTMQSDYNGNQTHYPLDISQQHFLLAGSLMAILYPHVINPLKCSGVRQLHLKVLNAIQV